MAKSSGTCSGLAKGNMMGWAFAPTLTARAYLSPKTKVGI
jgi:hypothetical protein